MALCLLVLSVAGCGAFNASFLNVLDPTGSGRFQRIDNAPGHVVLSVVNNAEVDERLIGFLEGRLVLTDAEKRALRPRIRMRVRVTFIDGSVQTIEFITGTQNFVDPAFAGQADPDLNQNDLDNAVVRCDVASVQVEPGSNIEVFVPVELTAFELFSSTSFGGQVVTSFEPRERLSPRFRPLQVDQVDEDGNVTLQSNIGVRDVPSPVTGLTCGSVVAIVINGVLSVPFLEGVSDAPSFDRQDEATQATIGGRYEFLVTVQ